MRSKAQHEGGEVTQGLRAGLAVISCRPGDVMRIVYDARQVGREVAELTKWAASRGVPCEAVSAREVDRIADSAHHDGLCVMARARRWASTQELGDVLTRSRGAAVALDRVRNPYNVGAILRSAAFFGLEAALVGAAAPHPGLAPMAVRVAEGGVEHLRLARTTDLADTLARLRSRGATVLGADARASTGGSPAVFARRPLVLVLGNEREGLGDRVRAQCDATVAVRGSGRIESLNVAVAAGVLIGHIVGPV